MNTDHKTVRVDYYPGTDFLVITTGPDVNPDDWDVACGLVELLCDGPLGEPEVYGYGNLWAPVVNVGRLRNIISLLD